MILTSINRPAVALLILGAVPVMWSPLAAAQQPAQQPAQASAQSNAHPVPESGKEALGPSSDSIRPYRPAGRDPFKIDVVVKTGARSKGTPKVVGFPAIDVRRAEFRQKVVNARRSGQAEPDPLTQYLVSELDVLGVFSDEKGQGVFLRAQPTGTTFFVRQSARCYNGQVVRVESDSVDLAGSRVVFKETSFTEVDGKQTPTDRLISKTAGQK
jgi:hypothetical protein